MRGDGRCLENCTAIHTCGDEDEGENIRKLINNHIADNWESYWKSKVSLPYKEKVVIDGKEEFIEKKTSEEMIDFLKNDDKALKVYSNGHELMAIANLFNIRIHIFTYKGKTGGWNVLSPDPAAPTSVEPAAN